MKKRMIIPATVATLASTISAMPLQTLALTDAVTGVDVLQGVLFAFFDENNDSINDVTIEIFDVSTLQVNANDNYDISGLTPIKTFTSVEATSAFSLENGKYVAKITKDEHILTKYDSDCDKNGANEIVFNVNGGLTQLNLGLSNKNIETKDVLSVTLMSGDDALSNVAVNVVYEAFNGTQHNVGEFVTGADGKISFSAVADDMPAGGVYYCSLKDEIEGYYAEEYNVLTLQAIEGECDKTWYFIEESANVFYNFSFFDEDSWEPMADFEFELLGEDGTLYEFKTNSDGNAQVELPKGKYTISTKNENMSLSETVIDIQREGMTSVFVTDNTPKGMATFYVTDSESNDVSGLSYDLYDNQNNLLFENMPIEGGLGVVYDLLFGDYKIVIKDIPAKYASDNGTKTINFTVNAESVNVPVVLMMNTAIYGDCSIELEITDADTNKKLLGETVSIINEFDEVLQTVQMDEDGFAIFENLPEGTFHFALSSDSKYYIVDGQTVTVNNSNKVAWQEIQAKKLTTTLVIGTQAPNPALVQSLSISLYKNGSIFGTYQMKDGSLTIPNLTVGDYEVVVNNGPTTYKLTSDNTFSITTADRVINQTLVFEVATAPLNVYINDADSDNLISNVQVEITDSNGNIVESGIANGGLLTVNLPMGTYTVSATAPDGYTAMDDKTVTLSVADEPVDVHFETAYRVATIALTVTDEESYAVSNAVIDIVNESGVVVASKTFADGEYYTLIEDLPFGKYTIRTKSYDDTTYVKPAEMTIELSEQKTYTVDYMFEKIPETGILGDVSLVLKDEAGNSVSLDSDVLIAIYDADGNIVMFDYAKADGTLSFSELTAGEYTASIFEAGSPWTATAKSDVKFTVVANETTMVEMTLYKGIGSAVFNVTDNETGKAVANVTIELFRNGESIGTYVTDANGQIKIDELEIGTYVYNIVDVPDGYEGAPQSAFDVTVDEKTTIDIILVAQTGQAVLNIVDKDGNLLYETVAITLISADGTEYNYTTSSGSINTGWIKTGKYEIKVNNEIEGYSVVSAEDVEIVADNTQLHDIVFARNMGKATVKVAVQNLDNVGLAGATVEIRNADGVLITTRATANDGTIQLSDLEIGRYSATIVGTLPDGYSALTGTAFEITKDCNENVVVYVLRDVGKVGISVVDGDGNAIVDMPVTLTGENGNPLGTVTSNASGIANFVNVPTGNYIASVGADAGTHDIEGDFEYHVTKDADMSGTIYVTRHKGWLTVQCNKNIEGIAFDVYDGDTVVASGVTDAAGSAVIENLPTGNYTVKFTNSPAQYEDLTDANITISKNEETILNIELKEKASKLTVKYVYDLTGNPTAGVKFEVTTLTGVVVETYTTDATGAVEMTLPQGYYFLKTKEVPAGYEMPADQAFEIVENEDVDITVRLELATSFGEFALMVQDSANNSGIADATVKLYTENGSLYKTLTTDSKGQIYDGEIVSGNYYAVVTKDGYAEKVLENIVIEEGMMFYDTVLLDASAVETGELSVTVYDNGTGAVLAGASVCLRNEAGDIVEALTSDANGVVTFSNVEYGNYKISAEAEGYVASGRISTIIAAETQSASIRLDACTTGSLLVNVHNDSDVAIGDALITLNGEHEYEIRTNDSGLAELPIVEAGTYEISINVEGHEPYTKTINVEANKENTLDVELIEIKLGNIAFTVTDQDDAPLANVKITLSDGTIVYTNENGLVSLENKDIGTYSAEFALDGYEGKQVEFNVEKDTTTRVEVSLNKIITTGTLVVNVADEDGNAIKNAIIAIDGKTYETDADGFVSIPELEAGAYEVTISKDGYNTLVKEISITAKTTTTANVTMKKIVTTGTINIVVTDVNGNALTDATIAVDDGKDVKTFTTDDTGLMTLVDLEEGSYKITVSKDGYKNYISNVEVEAGNTYTVNAKLEEIAQQGNLNIVVKDKDGNKIEGASVVVNGQTVLSNADGVAAFADLDAGTYRVEITKEGYDKFIANVEVVAGATKQANATLTKTVTTGKLVVTVTDNNGNALAGADVVIGETTYHADENGAVTLDEIEAGVYNIKVSKDGYVEETHTVTIVAKQESRLNVQLDEIDTTGDLVVTVVDENDELLKNAVVEIDGKTVKTDENGVANINDLEEGTYDIKVSKDGYESKSGTIEITAGVINRATVTLKKEIALGNVHVVVEDVDALKLKGATVNIYNMNDKLIASGVTDENGELTVSDLEAGRYQINVEYKIDENSGFGYIGYFTIEKDETTEVLVKFEESSIPETTGDAYITVMNHNNELLENVEVKLSNGTLVSGKTAPDGTITFEDLAPGEYDVIATLNGYHTYTGKITVEVGEVAEATIKLQPITTGSLTVYVKDKDGAALADATIEIAGKTYVTNAEGTVYIEDLEAGDYTVKASLNGYVAKSESVSVIAMSDAECTITLDKEVYTGNGKVVIKDLDGEPLAGATVKLGEHTLQTDENGIALFENLEAGTYEVVVTKHGFKQQKATIVITAKETETLEMFLLESDGSVRFTVKDEDGNLLKGATVAINGETYTTDENGKITVNELMPNGYDWKVSLDGYYESVGYVEVKADELSDVVVVLDEIITTGALSVKVVDENGAALVGANVKVGGTTAVTDENGMATIHELEAGDYNVVISKDGYVEQTVEATIIAEQTTEKTVTLAKEITTGSVKVVVTDKSGNAIANTSVTISGKTYTTDENGVVTVSDIEAGTYEVVVFKSGYESYTASIVVAAKEEALLNVVLDKTPEVGTISFIVGDDSGNIISNAKITINGKTYLTDKNGKVDSIELPLGTHEFKVEAETYTTVESIIVVTAEAQTVTITMGKKAGSLSLFVEGFYGGAIEDALVYIRGNDQEWNLHTDANGNISISNMPEGKYEFVITKDGYISTTGSFEIHDKLDTIVMTRLMERRTHAPVQFIVTDKQGNVLANAEVDVEGIKGVTDAEGRLMLNVPLDYNVDQLVDKEYKYTVSKDGYYEHEGTFHLGPTAITMVPVSLEKIPDYSFFTFQIKDAGGNLMKDVTITISDGTDVTTLTTDEDGYAELLNLLYGKYTIVVSKEGYKSITLNETLDSKDGKHIALKMELDVPPIEVGTAIITVVDTNGNPIGNSEVVVLSKDGSYRETFFTNAAGNITIDLDEGEFIVSAFKSGYVSDSGKMMITLNEVTELTLTLEELHVEEKAYLEVNVKNQDDESLVNAKVTITNEAGEVVYEGTLNNTSHLYLEDLADGVYNIKVTKTGHKSYETAFSMVTGETTIVNAVLEEIVEEVKAGAFDILVTNENGTPLGMVVVTILNEDGTLFGSYSTLSNGKIYISAVPEGKYSMYASYNGIDSNSAYAEIVGDQITTVKIIVDASKPGKPDKPNGGDNVQTSDNSNVLLYGLLAVLSAVGAIFTRKDKKKKEDK